MAPGAGIEPARGHGNSVLPSQLGYLKTLPDDYTGPRHVVTVRQLPPVEPGEDWFEWEERTGPDPASNAPSPNDEIVVQVRYVEAKPKA
jgi:hypothetical protein